MALPLGILGIGASALGGVTSALGAFTGAAAQSAMYSYQAGIAKQNEQFALNAGERQAATSGMASRLREGQIVAGQAASGFDVNSGTNKDVQQSQKLIDQTEQTNIRSNANERAYGFAAQSEVDVAAADNAKTAGDLGVASSILGAAGSVASKWTQGITAGTFSSDPFNLGN